MSRDSKDCIYRFNQLFKLRGWITWGIVAYLLINNFTLSNSINSNGKFFIIGLCTVIVYVQSRSMYYFQIANHHLIIRNENFFWFETKIDLNDILAIVLDKNVMLIDILKSRNLRIILNDYEELRMGADLLRKRNWQELKTDFEKMGITVRDEF